MGIHAIRMPDIGEGIAETEIAEWLVSIGQMVREDEPLVAVMTDKATVEIPSPVAGKVVWLAAEPGAMLAVGAELIRLEVAGAGNRPDGDAPQPPEAARPDTVQPDPAQPDAARPDTAKADPARPEAGQPDGAAGQTRPAPAPVPPASTSRPASPPAALPRAVPLRAEGEKPLAPPSVRARARAAGVDLRMVRGSGPAGRITQGDLSAFIASGGMPPAAGPRPDETVEEIRVIGLRRKIAERMEIANHIPHITIVEEVDATALEDLRAKMNLGTDPGANPGRAGAKLTILPFIGRAIVRALADQPMLNVHYDAGAGLIRRFGAVHLGIAAQTPSGLMVPVVRHAEALPLRDLAAEIARVAAAAKDGTARREELSGSTISITSLGALGAIATTPILNAPEVAIVGVNRLAVRPFWNGAAFEPRKMMNLSCSFDHRVIDGWDAAVFVARLRELLETPALIFVEA